MLSCLSVLSFALIFSLPISEARPKLSASGFDFRHVACLQHVGGNCREQFLLQNSTNLKSDCCQLFKLDQCVKIGVMRICPGAFSGISTLQTTVDYHYQRCVTFDPLARACETKTRKQIAINNRPIIWFTGAFFALFVLVTCSGGRYCRRSRSPDEERSETQETTKL